MIDVLNTIKQNHEKTHGCTVMKITSKKGIITKIVCLRF